MIDLLINELEKYGSSLGDTDVPRRVLALITGLGSTVVASDIPLLALSINRIEAYVLNVTHQLEIPPKLHPFIAHRAVGIALEQMVQTGRIDKGQVTSSISLGDTSVSFDTSTTPEARFAALINGLKNWGGEELLAYRRIKW